MILDANTSYHTTASVHCSVEQLRRELEQAWDHLIPNNAVLSLSFSGRCCNTLSITLSTCTTLPITHYTVLVPLYLVEICVMNTLASFLVITWVGR